jgi:hypothetical protein
MIPEIRWFLENKDNSGGAETGKSRYTFFEVGVVTVCS